MKFLKKKPTVPIDELPEIVCENCGYHFKGHFCPDCGQEVAEFDRPFGFMIYDFVGNLFAFDTRFFTTFKYLLFRPGFLTKEFFAGRRVRYSPPFRIFVFLSFVMFLLLQMLSDRAVENLEISKPVLSSHENSTHQPQNYIRLNTGTDSLVNTSQVDSLNEVKLDTTSEGISVNVSFDDINSIRNALEQEAVHYEKKLQITKDPERRRKFQKYVLMFRMPELVIAKVLKYLSWAFFLLLPLFALILKLFFIRKKRYFIQHFIFSIHVHSMIFFIISIMVALALLFGSSVSILYYLLMLSAIIYQVIALKVFYNIKTGSSILRFLGINIFYQILLWTAIIFALVRSLMV
jgi:hypothetical protein